MGGSKEKIANLPSETTSLNNEEKNKSATNSRNKETKESRVTEGEQLREHSAEKSDRPESEFAEPQAETTEAT